MIDTLIQTLETPNQKWLLSDRVTEILKQAKKERENDKRKEPAND